MLLIQIASLYVDDARLHAVSVTAALGNATSRS